MTSNRLLKALILCPILLCIAVVSQAQTKTISGKILDDKGNPIVGASVVPKGGKGGTTTDATGHYTLIAPASTTTVIVTYVGYAPQELDVTSSTDVSVTLQPESSNLTDVVVIGYGTARKKDLTGAVTSIQSKNFNKGTYTSPDQLIQGKAAGVQMINSSGQPGGVSIVKIRGNATVTGTGQPLYVVDGVPLDGRSPRPSVGDLGFGGGNPASNPLNFINPTDIASIDILKDASATAIYGSRAAYGVVLITTKRGSAGQTKLDVNSSIGFSKIAHRIDVLDASQFRQALTYYGIDQSNDHGGNVDALDAILRTATVQNYNVAISGGNDNGKYRLSFGVLDQPGIIQKSGIRKYAANFNANFKFLDSKKLGLDISLIPSQYIEDIAPITTNAGAQGSLIGQALQWNPTLPLKVGDSIVDLNSNSIYNPLGVSEATNDRSKVTTIFATISPYYKFTDWLTYKFQYSVDYATGVRRTSVTTAIDVFSRAGFAQIGQNELSTQQFTHTLSFDKAIATDLNLNAVLGFEYLKFTNKGSTLNGTGQVATAGGFGDYGLDYTNYVQYSNPTNRGISSFIDPTNELQSYFARAILNYKGKYLLTGTFRRDGSTKFGKNNKYGNFPSVAAAWDITKESFFKMPSISTLKLRGGWGKTGNQEFPTGASQKQYVFQSGGGQGQITNADSLLKWQSDRQYNIGIDIGILKNRITATVDYFNKLTTDLLYPTPPIGPAPPGTSQVTWKNIQGNIKNTGVEASVYALIVDKPKFTWDINVNATFLHNIISGLTTPIPTGALDGQGITGTTVEVLRNGLPINAFYTRRYTGLDKDGFSMYPDGDSSSYQGSPNPKVLLGFGTTVSYSGFSLVVNFNGNFGQKLYNNTFNNVINIGDIKGGRNIALDVYKEAIKESTANRVTASGRYIENASYLKMTNATLSYNFGNLGKSFHNVSLYATGQNLFTITKFKGFDPEVNVDKNVNGVPSVGIEYEPYPSARTITFGLNFSL